MENTGFDKNVVVINNKPIQTGYMRIKLCEHQHPKSIPVIVKAMRTRK